MGISYVLISCATGDEESAISELKKIDTIKEIVQVMGSYDIIVKLEESSSGNLRNTIASKVRTIDKIRATLTLTTIESHDS